MYKITYHYQGEASTQVKYVNKPTAEEATRWVLADAARTSDKLVIFDEVVTLDSIYKSRGYESRADYLRTLADDYGLEYEIVYHLAQTLGPNEDFDGLISACEDAEMMLGEM